jgi:hypothetical protein
MITGEIMKPTMFDSQEENTLSNSKIEFLSKIPALYNNPDLVMSLRRQIDEQDEK